ncbi:E3 ubiquitin-protein ligase At4g11680-like isoform X2 [Quercus robur]|uniref:E3 ubiquitin-protein ligase At4g11680-like isoform X2 n=1 Tax=Quercus robur TaxID=38942 RepID=UPI0021622C2C|nr:E3 ubiquitin-protein ligase At4g11680-like isoform X2 [Quercus robur]
MASTRSPNRSTSDIVDTSPFLNNNTTSSNSSDDSNANISPNNPNTSRRFVQRQSLRQAARFLRQASSRRVMREPSMMVRETAAEQLEERQSDWAYSKPVVILDVLWNLAFVVVAATVLFLSRYEAPSMPLRLWILGYAIQCLLHMACVCVEYRRRLRRRRQGREGGLNTRDESGQQYVSLSEHLDEEGSGSVAKHLESANTMFSFIWWIIGFYWVSAGGQDLAHDSPQLYWLCIIFLGFDVFFVVFCVALACVIGIAVCCCLPCIIALLYAVADQECCICLSAYDDGVELRELPCGHHFHCNCVDKWLYINATCPLCKYNILKSSSHGHEEV